MILDWKRFGIDEWAGMTADQWSKFLVEPFEGNKYGTAATAVYVPGASRTEVYSAGAEKGQAIK